MRFSSFPAFLILLFINLCGLHAQNPAHPPFQRGVNLTDYFQKPSAGQVSFSPRMKEDLANIKSLGCDVVRLPINLHFMTSGAPDYSLDPHFLEFLDQTIDWAEEEELYLIIDNHTFDPAVDTEPDVEEPLLKVWSQIARRYKDRSDYLCYEILNEPHGIDLAIWGAIQGRVLEQIRSIDQKHYIIVGAANWNSYSALESLPEYPDDRLIYTFHFYDPFLFTHQGASWTGPSLESLAGVPFPYDRRRMPAVPEDLKSTWIEGNLRNYRQEASLSKLEERLDQAVQFQQQRNVPIFCGEWGVYDRNSDPADRVEWYRVISEFLEEKDIAWTLWDYRGSFGIFEKEGNDQFEYDLNVPLLEVLNLNAPPQEEWVKEALDTGFTLYDDYLGNQIIDGSYGPAGSVNYYSSSPGMEGQFCIKWTGAKRYDVLRLDFQNDPDLSSLFALNYALRFRIKADLEDGKIDLRLRNREQGSSMPWRMGMTLDESLVSWDGEWHEISISLNDLQEKGAWKKDWYNPQGEFDWTKVDLLEFVAEHHDLEDSVFYIDNIRIEEMD